MYSRVLKHKEGEPGLKILLSFGGWNFGTETFTSVAKSLEKRKHFIETAIALLRKYKFDGLDLDWEFPLDVAKDHANFVKEMKTAFVEEAKSSGNEQLLLTAAVSAGKDKIDKGYDVQLLARDLDLIFLMTYDFHGSWDKNVDLHEKLYPTEGETVEKGTYNAEFAANYWVQKGMPKEKIIIGIPTYARGWTLANSSQTIIGAESRGASRLSGIIPEGGVAAYWEICDYLKDGGNETVDREGVGAYMVKGDQWYSYDNPETVKIKMEWLKKEGYGGAFIWSLDTDDFKGASCGRGLYPLLSAIKEGLKSDNATNLTTSTESTSETTVTELGTAISVEDETTSTDGEQTTSGEITAIGGECLEPDGVFPDHSDCHRYIHCSNGYAYTVPCPMGTFFNDEIKGCDHLWRIPPRCETTSTTNDQTTTGGEATRITAPEQITIDGAECLEPDGIFPDHSDCHRYIQCSNGYAYKMSCPASTFYNNEIKVCDHMWKAPPTC